MAISEEAYKYFISKYDPSYCTKLLDHCIAGGSIESFAALINNIPEAMAYWANRYVEFEVALRVAYWKSYYFWEQQAIDDLKQIKEFKTFNHSTFALIMKNRFQWRSNSDDLLIAIGKLSDKELEERARKILEAKQDRKNELNTIEVKE